MRKIAAFGVLAMIAGCESPKQDVAHLTFNYSTYSERGLDEGERPLIYGRVRGMLSSVLKENGVDPEKVSIEGDPDDRKSVIISVDRNVAESDALESFYGRLDGVMKDRQELPVTMTVNLDLDSLSIEESGASNEINDLRESIEVDLVPDSVVLTHRSNPLLGPIKAALSGSGSVTSQTYCHVVARLDPRLPFFILKLDGSGDDEGYYVVWDSVKIGAEVSVDSSGLQNMLESGETVVSQPTRGSEAFDESLMSSELAAVEFPLGSLGDVELDDIQRISYVDYSTKRSQCESKAAEIGRPFSFYFGNTIDRMVSFGYVDEQ